MTRGSAGTGNRFKMRESCTVSYPASAGSAFVASFFIKFGDFCYESMSFGKLHTVGPTPRVAGMIVPEKSDVTKVTGQDTIMNH